MTWFKSWFDSPYYHLLYKHRDYREAELFIDHLLEQLRPAPGARILDLACGRGRHSIYLNNKGFEVTGIDLSEQNINYCSQFENATLSFFVHDMRHLFRVNDFDFVFNLFTSFGYFEKHRDNYLTVRNAASSLRKNGTLVIDFLNVQYAVARLNPAETAQADEIKFNINREYKDGYFIKQIEVNDKGNLSNYVERVEALTLENFNEIMTECGLEIAALFGSYTLEPYDSVNSPRLIIEAVKK